jgi:hypothetical protein
MKQINSQINNYILDMEFEYEQNRHEAALFYCLCHKRGHMPKNVPIQERNELTEQINNSEFTSQLIKNVGIVTIASAYAVLASVLYPNSY